MKVSVIVPAYNVEATIERCLDSVLAQNYPLHEIIVVEDCSTDGTLEKLRKYQGSIKLITHNSNQGLGMTRGEGIMSATGDYIYCIDSDDYIHPDAIGYLVKNADGGDIVTGGIDSQPLYGLERMKLYYKLGRFINNRLIKKSLFEKAPHSKIRLLSDADTLPRLLYYAEKTTYAPLMLYYYNSKNSKSLSNSGGKIKRNIYKTLVALHGYYFFLEKEREWLFSLPFHGKILTLLAETCIEAMKNIEEYNKYDKETTEIFNLIYDRMTEVKKENDEQ